MCSFSGANEREFDGVRVLAPDGPWYAGPTGAIVVDALSNTLRYFLTCTISVQL